MFKLIKRLLGLETRTRLVFGNTGREIKLSGQNLIELQKGPPVRTATVEESMVTSQLVCPYCCALQTHSTGRDLSMCPPDYWMCESCMVVMKIPKE